MNFRVSLQPTDGLLISDMPFDVDVSARRFLSDGGSDFTSSNEDITLASEVKWQIADTRFQTGLAPIFTAPHNMHIVRICRKDTL